MIAVRTIRIVLILTLLGAISFGSSGCISGQSQRIGSSYSIASSNSGSSSAPQPSRRYPVQLTHHSAPGSPELVAPGAPIQSFTDPNSSQHEMQVGEPITIDLPTALSMAVGQNPQIAFAAARYRESYARLNGAQRLWLPSIRAGVSFNNHSGNLQASDGNVLDVDRSSLQAGLGVQAVGAGTPAVPGVAAQFHTSDALFQPKIERNATAASQAATQTATNDTLLATALAHLELLRTAQQLRIAEETRDNSGQLAKLTKSFAQSGQGPHADADRAATEFTRRRNEVSRANEAWRVAGARMAELLRLDPTAEILPNEITVVPVNIVDHAAPVTELLAAGLSNRPELAEAHYLVGEAVQRYRREKFAPLLPSVLLGISQSRFGGGLGSEVDNYRDRFDLDATAFWELRNLGFGDVARTAENRARFDQARARQAAMMDRVAREIVEGHQQVRSRSEQIAVAESGVQYATNSYQRNMTRIHEGQGLPIEVLQSIQALDESRREYLRTIVDHNEAQFRLQRALGWPIHG